MEALPLSPALDARAATALAQNGHALANTGENARKVAEDFEGVFLFEVLNSMYAGLGTDGLFGGGQSEKMFRSMLNEEVAKSISRSGGVGIADSIYREIIHLQEIDS